MLYRHSISRSSLHINQLRRKLAIQWMICTLSQQMTGNLTRQFIDLGGGATQQFLKIINNQQINLKQLIPSNIYQQLVVKIESYDQYFQNIFQTFNQYQQDQTRFQLMKLHYMTNPTLFNIIMSFLSLNTKVNDIKAELVNSTGQMLAYVIKANSKLISSIKIDYLNMIIEIGIYIFYQYNGYCTFFNDEINSIEDLASKIQDNYFQIIGTSTEIMHAKESLSDTLIIPWQTLLLRLINYLL